MEAQHRTLAEKQHAMEEELARTQGELGVLQQEDRYTTVLLELAHLSKALENDIRSNVQDTILDRVSASSAHGDGYIQVEQEGRRGAAPDQTSSSWHRRA